MQDSRSGDQAVRLAEVAGALALATDLGTGQPLEHSMRTTVLAVRLGQMTGISGTELADTYYAALLHSAGCTSDGHEAAFIYGDDITPRAVFALVDAGNVDEVVAFLRTHVGAGRPDDVRTAMVEHALEHGLTAAQETFAMHCEVAQRFAAWLGIGSGTQAALEHVFERWDGRGFPGAASGDSIPRPMRLVHIARDISIFLTAAGRNEALGVISGRSGGAYDPELAGLAVHHFDELAAGVDESRLWAQMLEIEPAPHTVLSPDELDAAFEAIAAFIALKSPWFRTHSTEVAQIAEAAAWRLGLPAEVVTSIRRAALAQDLGCVGVSNAIWEKPGALGFGEWERVRLHPHYTERVFVQSTALAAIGGLAGSHHERLDGSGYHRGRKAAELDLPARIVAAADCCCALQQARPHRPASDREGVEKALEEDVAAGRLDAEAVDAVLAAAGHPVGARRRERPAGLTAREVEVLMVLVQGKSNQEIADALGISPKTVGHHVQHVYDKAGVRSRAAATLWAFEHALLPLP